MPQYDQTQAECLVFTFKEGLLSKVAHDLKIKVTSFVVQLEGGAVRAEFDTRSLRVVNAMKDGHENPSALSEGDKAKIAEQIADEVLHASEHPKALFVSRSMTRRPDGGYSITGDLTLHGVSKPLQVETRLADGAQQATVELHQPDYGVTPFKAMMGTLKVKPGVIVQLRVPDA